MEKSADVNSPGDLAAWRSALVADLGRVAVRDRWGRALCVLGWVHLAFSLVHHAFYVPDDSRAPLTLGLWAAEVLAVLVVMRRIAGRGWWRATPLAGVLVRVWATFLILSLSVATLNGLTGWAIDWFKLAWCSLGTFGFATTAWLVSPWFLAPAFQMYFTGLLSARHPGLVYVIHGVSWWAALQGIGWVLERRRPSRWEPNPEPGVRSAELVGAGHLAD